MAIGNTDVQKQIAHMIRFIEQEASEKIEEIQTKTIEECEIEKGRLVQEQRMKIIEYYEKQEKQVELKKRIQSSHMLNQARLKVLEEREALIRGVLDEAKQRLMNVTKDEAMYGAVLQKLISQALFQLVEPSAVIICRPQDVNLVTKHINGAIEEYQKATNKECKLTVDKERFLSKDSCGGVEVLARNGKIRCTNTLESRLESISRNMLPQIRVELFGRNQNRKFDD